MNVDCGLGGKYKLNGNKINEINLYFKLSNLILCELGFRIFLFC